MSAGFKGPSKPKIYGASSQTDVDVFSIDADDVDDVVVDNFER
jgi:hypothetical protein